ncbi:uncharacterized protein LOC128227512 [Mya arenaria]|uniref:uncharacterized protein LOC128227512 n=1 Tax=Mya arenaria TaxID=6604 RepID=UPI0022E60B1D|nr:uncharacterized protein LOC128227512 [Mya arenaria]XP_052794095.1 uncharacterized protein LOC128227512 [Mya arenaria]XP_052794096.1 uncharacterized protein LOC128227512 [Mya arenaria]
MDYIKFNLTLFRCEDSSKLEISPTLETSKDDVVTVVSSEAHVIKNVLGDDLYSSLRTFFRFEGQNEAESDFEPEIEDIQQNHVELQKDPCSDIISSVELYLTWNTVIVIISVLIGLVFFVLLACQSRRIFKALISRYKHSSQVEYTDINQDSTVFVSNDHEGLQTCDLASSLAQQTDDIHKAAGVKLFYQPYIRPKTGLVETDLSKFLEETTAKLFSKLDRLLLKGGTADQTQSALATPRLARRTLVRRQRVGSSPMLSNTATLQENDSGTGQRSKTWQQFRMFESLMGWNLSRQFSFDETNSGRSSMKLMQFFQRISSLTEDHIRASSLVVNYVLYLVKCELENIGAIHSDVYRFVKFIPSGSTKYGTKVSRVNTCDFLMLLQSPLKLDGAIHEVNCDHQLVPPGMVVITLDKDATVKGSQRDMVIHCDINGDTLQCLSSKHLLKFSEEVIDICIQNLYTRWRSDMDKLPFTVKRSTTAQLQLSIDTRAIVGLGEAEVKVDLIPVVAMATEGPLQSPLLYGTPRMEDSEPKTPLGSNSGFVNPNCLWKVRYDDFDSAFAVAVDRRNAESYNQSCNKVCLMIVKAILTACDRKNLLDRGIFPSYHVETVMNFLLSESEPFQWAPDCLADRFSDTVHFLQQSYTNGRLPAFFMNNQHLNKKMPQVGGNKLLTRRRQHNLLAETSCEGREKCLVYMKERIREVGLTDCLNEEYSPDMWEYEFFLFN